MWYKVVEDTQLKKDNMITTLHIYDEKRGKYLIARCVARLPAAIKTLLADRLGWENTSTHPTVYDPKLDAIIIFRNDFGKVDYERRMSPEYKTETDEIKSAQNQLKLTLENMQKELAQLKERQSKNKK